MNGIILSPPRFALGPLRVSWHAGCEPPGYRTGENVQRYTSEAGGWL